MFEILSTANVQWCFCSEAVRNVKWLKSVDVDFVAECSWANIDWKSVAISGDFCFFCFFFFKYCNYSSAKQFSAISIHNKCMCFTLFWSTDLVHVLSKTVASQCATHTMSLNWQPSMNLPATHECWYWHFLSRLHKLQICLIKLLNELEYWIFLVSKTIFFFVLLNIYNVCSVHAERFLNFSTIQSTSNKTSIASSVTVNSTEITNTSLLSRAKKQLSVRWNFCNENTKNFFFVAIQMWRMYDCTW